MISIGALLHRRWRRLLRTFVIVLAAAVPAAGMLAALPPVVAFASPAIRCAPTVGASAGGGEHTLSVKSDGTARAWGNNWAGQLGDGGVEASSTTPKAVVGLTNVAAMAAGANHSLALTSDGTVWAWGYNADGELGDGTTLSRNTPQHVAGLHNVVAVAGGNGYSMAAEADGTLWAWGYNGDGELGNGNYSNSYVPVQVSGLTTVAAIAAGDSTAMAVTSDGGVYTWGSDTWGQLGNGVTGVNTNTPGRILSGATQVAAGTEHGLVLLSSGQVESFGHDNYGQLGSGSYTTSASPVAVQNLTATAISAGGFDSMAVASDGTPRAWGNNLEGEVGNPSAGNYPNTPVQPANIGTVAAVAAGGHQPIPPHTSGNAWTLGGDPQCQLRYPPPPAGRL